MISENVAQINVCKSRQIASFSLLAGTTPARRRLSGNFHRLKDEPKAVLEDLYGSELRFPLPYKLQRFAGSRTAFEVNLHIKDEWFMQGWNSFENGTVNVDIQRPKR